MSAVRKRSMVATILIFLIVLSVLVIVHELGHFFAAKYFGVEVQEFGVGFPPRAKTLYTSKDGVSWTLNWLPIGGFVKLKGEDGRNSDDPTSFSHKKPFQRIIILTAGVVMNVLLGFVLLTIGFSIGWPQDITEKTEINPSYIKEEHIVISLIEKDTPAAAGDMRRGDIIRAIDGISVTDISTLQEIVARNKDKEIVVAVVRGDVVLEKKVVPKEITFTYEGASKTSVNEKITKVGIGVGLRKLGIIQYPPARALLVGLEKTFAFSGRIFAAFYSLLKDLITTRKISPDIGGPVMIATITGQVARLGIIYIIQFVALLSLNLAIINMLPFPALDGGRVFFILIERFKGRAVSVSLESWFHIIGFWVLIGLTVLITIRDIARLQLWERLKNLIAL